MYFQQTALLPIYGPGEEAKREKNCQTLAVLMLSFYAFYSHSLKVKWRLIYHSEDRRKQKQPYHLLRAIVDFSPCN